jgi:hypothetical protein
MGWGRTLLLGDIGNRLDIEDVERDIADLRQKLSVAFRRDATWDEKLLALAKENAEIKLYLVALVRLLTTKGAVSREELRAIVAAVDSEDGRVDGGYNGKIGS